VQNAAIGTTYTVSLDDYRTGMMDSNNAGGNQVTGASIGIGIGPNITNTNQ
jgi:hypothetical protein